MLGPGTADDSFPAALCARDLMREARTFMHADKRKDKRNALII